MKVAKVIFATFFCVGTFHYKRKDVLVETSLRFKKSVLTFFYLFRLCLFV